jgi:hypothetical protein
MAELAPLGQTAPLVLLRMSLAAMLADLPTHCTVGTKRNAKGHTTSCIGYKLHLDIADGEIPISAILTSASLQWRYF